MKNILLIGVGRFGRHIAMHLNQLGHQVMAVDRNEERIDAVMPYVTNAQIGDSVNADFLRSLGVGNYDVCIVTIGSSFQDSLETACLLKELGAKWVVSGQNGMYRKNSCCGTERIRLFIRKNRWQNGQRFVTARIMCLTILKLTVSMRFLRLKSRRTGLEKNVGQLDIRKNTVLIFWQQENMEKQMLRCLRRQFWMAMLPYWFLVNIKRSRNVFESEREVISVLSVGLLFVTLVGFLSGGVLVDQIETFFTENRREEPETGQNFTENRKQEQGTGEKKIS